MPLGRRHRSQPSLATSGLQHLQPGLGRAEQGRGSLPRGRRGPAASQGSAPLMGCAALVCLSSALVLRQNLRQQVTLYSSSNKFCAPCNPCGHLISSGGPGDLPPPGLQLRGGRPDLLLGGLTLSHLVWISVPFTSVSSSSSVIITVIHQTPVVTCCSNNWKIVCVFQLGEANASCVDQECRQLCQ